MIIFEIVTPGSYLDYEDKAWTSTVQPLLDSLTSSFFEANTALNLFLEAQLSHTAAHNLKDWEQDRRRRMEIFNVIRQEISGSAPLWECPQEIFYESEVRFKREKWMAGKTPRTFITHASLIYARAFLYALDTFDKFLGILANERKTPEGVAILHKKMADYFPDLRGLRNSAQHLEDRTRGLGAGQKPLELKPIENQLISAPAGGVLALNNLNGTKYGCTMSNGHYGEIDVSSESMQRLQEILEATFSLFKWSGPKQHNPPN